MKRRILFGWEFGAGNGHAVILGEIARHFSPESHELRFAMRYPETALRAGIDARLVIQAPGNPARRAKAIARATYGEFVCEALFGVDGDFDRKLAGWSDIIAAFKPDAVVAEYAPSLSLWARGRVPVVATGSGYSLPPTTMAEFPPLTSRPPPRFATESELLDHLNRHLRQAGCLAIERLPQLNAADAQALMTLPLFDPYAEQREGGYLGVVSAGGQPTPAQEAQGFLAYFDPEWQFEDAFLEGLRGAGLEGRAFLGPPLRRTAKRLAGSGILLCGKPFDLAREMPGKALALHKGSLGFAAAAAFAGVPQLLLPQNQENVLIAKALQDAGTALSLSRSKITAPAVAKMMKAVASDASMREAAHKLAQQLAPYRNRDPAKAAADMVRKFT